MLKIDKHKFVNSVKIFTEFISCQRWIIGISNKKLLVLFSWINNMFSYT